MRGAVDEGHWSIVRARLCLAESSPASALDDEEEDDEHEEEEKKKRKTRVETRTSLRSNLRISQDILTTPEAHSIALHPPYTTTVWGNTQPDRYIHLYYSYPQYIRTTYEEIVL